MNDFPAVSLVRAALGCRCPRCGRGRLYAGLLNVRGECEVCGLDLSGQDAGDGPAVFVIFFLGLIVVGLAALVEIKFAPPIWLHLALWLPAALVMTLGLLQPVKGVIVALQWSLGMHGFELAKARRQAGACTPTYRTA